MSSSTPRTTVVDTRALPWESSSWFLPTALTRVLSRDDDGDAVVLSRWVRGGGTPRPHPSRHYHLARKFNFFLLGELPHWEFDGPDDPGTLVVIRGRTWIDRRPGAIDGGGVPVGAVSAQNIEWLMLDDDPLVGLSEARRLTDVVSGALAEAVAVPVQRPLAAAVLHTRPHPPGAAILDTRLLPWQTHPFLRGALVQVLSRRCDGDPIATLTHIPAGRYPAAELPLLIRQPFRSLTYVLEGELRVWDEDGGMTELREGFWVDRPAEVAYGFGDEIASLTGCTLLEVRVRPGARFVKDGERRRHFSRNLLDDIENESPFVTEADRQADLRRLYRSGA